MTEESLLLHLALRRVTLIIPTNSRTQKFHPKTLKIAPTCFHPKIIFRQPYCSLLKSRIKNTH